MQLFNISHYGRPITNRQKFVALSSLVEGSSLKVAGIKCPQTFDDSLFAYGSNENCYASISIECALTRMCARIICVFTSLLSYAETEGGPDASFGKEGGGTWS